jgi:hypothetical protein
MASTLRLPLWLLKQITVDIREVKCTFVWEGEHNLLQCGIGTERVSGFFQCNGGRQQEREPSGARANYGEGDRPQAAVIRQCEHVAVAMSKSLDLTMVTIVPGRPAGVDDPGDEQLVARGDLYLPNATASDEGRVTIEEGTSVTPDGGRHASTMKIGEM